MAIVSTKWPLFEFYFGMWKLSIKTQLMTVPQETLTYEYIRVGIYWGSRELFHFRLYDTAYRKDTLKDLTTTGEYNKEQLEKIIKIATEELKRYE